MTIVKEYQILLEEAKSKKKQIKLFFSQLEKEKNEKKIFAVFNRLHQEVFEEIDCLRCANCCSMVGPMISDIDIRRMAAAENLKPSGLVSKYLRLDEDNDYVFIEMPCPFLNKDDHMCSIYTSRPKACREYPHTDDKRVAKLLNITYKNTFVCPAVYLIVKRTMFKQNI